MRFNSSGNTLVVILIIITLVSCLFILLFRLTVRNFTAISDVFLSSKGMNQSSQIEKVAEWQSFESAAHEGNFSVSLPSVPTKEIKQSNVSLSNSDIMIENISHTSTLSKSSFTIQVLKFVSIKIGSDRENLLNIIDRIETGYISSLNIEEVVSKKNVIFQGYVGIETLLKDNQRTTKRIIFAVPEQNSIYTLSETFENNEDSFFDKFTQSFYILK